MKKLPSQVGEMTLPEALEIFEFWQNCPPENEMLAMLARIYTTWEPKNTRPMTPEEHRASLEARWKSGAAMSPKQLFEATGGALALNGTAAGAPQNPAQMPGIGPFPGAH